MKRIFSIAIGVGMALCAVGTMWAKDKDVWLPSRYEGSMMPYDFSRVEAAEWPDSLSPRFCAYVARHGSRYMSSEKKFLKLEQALQEAQQKGSITSKGKEFLTLLAEVRNITGSRWGELSPLGVEEERVLGEQMYQLLDPLHSPSTILTVSSFVPRAEMTMYQFNHSLLLCNDSVTTVAATCHRFSDLVYCFAYDKVYADYRREGEWKEYVERYEEEKLPTEALERLLGTRIADKRRACDLTMQLYSVLQSLRAMGLPAPTDKYLDEEEIRACWQVSNLTHYLRNNVCALSTSCVSATTPLVEAIISGIDTAAGDSAGRPPVQLRGWFGHAETLLPLLSVLQIPGCFAMPHDPEDLEKTWQIQDITPLAANFAVILLQSPSGREYVATRLNGRNVEPIPGHGLIQPWSDVKQHWTYLLTAIQPRRR